MEKNRTIYNQMESLAQKHNCLPSQLALAWVLHQGDDVVPIPGESFISYLCSRIVIYENELIFTTYANENADCLTMGMWIMFLTIQSYKLWILRAVLSPFPL